MDALLHRPFLCLSLRAREGCGSDSHGRGTTTSPMGIRYPIPIRRGGLEGCSPSISAQPSGQGRGAAQRVEEARAELDELRGAVSAEQARLESLRQGARAIERDVAELEPIAAEIGRWEAANRAGKRAILDSIAARCAGAARAARAAIEELGDRIWALTRPRKAQRTVGDVMREATEVARATKALSRNHVAPTNGRPRGQAR